MFGWLTTLPVFVADAFRRDPEYLRLLCAQSTWGELTLSVARSCIGLGEEGGNNRGPFIRQLGGKQGASWCGWFVGYCARLAWSQMESKECPLPVTGGARRLWKWAAKHGRIVDRGMIRPGDLALWDRGDPDRPDDAWKAHIGIVAAAEPSGPWHVIEGNYGKPPALVKARRADQRKRLVGFARLPRVGP